MECVIVGGCCSSLIRSDARSFPTSPRRSEHRAIRACRLNAGCRRAARHVRREHARRGNTSAMRVRSETQPTPHPSLGAKSISVSSREYTRGRVTRGGEGNVRSFPLKVFGRWVVDVVPLTFPFALDTLGGLTVSRLLRFSENRNKM